MSYMDDFPVNGVVDRKFNTQAASGASITIGTDGTLRIYKNNSTTERSSLNGVTFSEDFDGFTGIHHLRIDLSDNTDAGFWAAGNEYAVARTGMTIDGQVVNAVLYHFSIERAGGVLALLKAAGIASGRLNVDVKALDGDTTAATNLRRSSTVIYVGSVTGAASTTTLVDATLTQADAHHWAGRTLIFVTGTLAYQATVISAFTPALDQLTFDALTSVPSGGDVYVIV